MNDVSVQAVQPCCMSGLPYTCAEAADTLHDCCGQVSSAASRRVVAGAEYVAGGGTYITCHIVAVCEA